MRNFEERMTEIKNRSHARIIRRKKQMTALCVPLMAALCVGGALLIPQHINLYKDTVIPTATTVVQYSGIVTVVNGNKTVTYSSRDIVDAVRHLVSALPPVEQTAMDTVQNNSHEFTKQTTALTINYTIILETEDGTSHYKLQGNVLSNRDTGEWYVLSDMQRDELLGLLELR